MRIVILFLFLFPQVLPAQECTLTRETDPYTKATRLSTGFMFFSGASLTIDADATEVDLMFSMEGANRCFDNNSTAVIHFEGSKLKMNLRNAGTMNCEGLFHFIYKNGKQTNAQLQKLTSQKISQVVFTGSDKKEIAVILSPQDQDLLIRLGTCLVNEAKTLIR